MLNVEMVNDVRRSLGFLSIEEVMGLIGNMIFDPFSVLISKGVAIGIGNMIYPCVTLQAFDDCRIEVGDNNVFHSNCFFQALSGSIRIGSGNQFGEGGFSAKANRPGANIEIGDEGRFLNGVSVLGTTCLGSGSQLLGQITVDSCTLEEGGSFRESDPNLRAGLLSGSGIARNITVPRGHVIVGSGTFNEANCEKQSIYHPRA